LNKQERLQFDRLSRLLEAERQRAEKAWEGYRNCLYELVDLKMKIEKIQRVMNGEE
jgi:hypothetical protein